jgi:ligand-binding sensor protein/AraC-like DNA-binding protein
VTDSKQWQSLQESLSLATELAIVTVDYKGIPLTKHSRRKQFCTIMRNDPQTSRYCVKSDSHAGLEGARLNETYTYLCHANIVDIAIPIIIDEQYYGAVMAGEVLVPPKEGDTLEKVVSNPCLEERILNDKKLRRIYDALPLLTLDHIAKMTQLIENISKYIFEEALVRDRLYNLYRSADIIRGDDPGESDIHTVEAIKKQLQKIEAHRTPPEPETDDSYNPLVRIAKNFVFDNLEEKITLRDTSKTLHVSESYLSRLFKKETGESFSAYVVRKKMEKASEALINSDESVSSISNYLGFSDCGYFIRLFDKRYGATPAVYRKKSRR